MTQEEINRISEEIDDRKLKSVLNAIKEVMDDDIAEVHISVFKVFAERYINRDPNILSAWIGLAGSYFKPVKVVDDDGNSFIVPPIMTDIGIKSGNINLYNSIIKYNEALDSMPSLAISESKKLVHTLANQADPEKLDTAKKNQEIFRDIILAVLENKKIDINNIEEDIEDDEGDDDVWE